MPDVGSYQFRGRDGSSWKAPVNVQGHDGTGWKRAKNVYAHNGTQWLEVWNSVPEMTITGLTASESSLSISGTADPNTFATTARFDYREVGTSTWNPTSNVTSGMGNGIDSAVAYSSAPSTLDPWKNWEARAVGTNAAGTGTSSTIQRDCRKQGVNGGSGWGYTSVTTYPLCNDCLGCGALYKTVVTTTWTKDGCPSYTTVDEGLCPGTGCGTNIPQTVRYISIPGYEFEYLGTPGYYYGYSPDSNFSGGGGGSYGCPSCPEPLDFTIGEYNITVCNLNGIMNIQVLSCSDCLGIYGV